MQNQPIQSTRPITTAFPQTPFGFRQLINVRSWHAIASADDAARVPGRCRPARPKATRLRRLGLLGLLGAGVLISGAVRAGQSVSISWNPSTNAAVAGYTFFRGTSSGVYTSQFNVGTNTAITLAGLTAGQMNYFTVAAYDSAGVTSPDSPEITYLVPGLVRLGAPPGPGKAAGLTFSAASGHSYDVQASTNLTTWATIWSSGTVTSNGWVAFQDPQGTTLPKRFYRLVLH